MKLFFGVFKKVKNSLHGTVAWKANESYTSSVLKENVNVEKFLRYDL